LICCLSSSQIFLSNDANQFKQLLLLEELLEELLVLLLEFFLFFLLLVKNFLFQSTSTLLL
jgi:hypothetical protein